MRSALCTTGGLSLSASPECRISRDGERCRAEREARALGPLREGGGLALTPSAKVRPVRESRVDVRLAVLRGVVVLGRAAAGAVVVEGGCLRRNSEG